MNFRNPTFTADGRIDCEIEHPVYGWVPFTADPNDSAEHGRAIYAAALEAGPAPYQAPEPQPLPVPASITFAQLMIGLVAEGWISEAEGDAWLRGTLPAAVEQLIATAVPEAARFAARARATRPSEVLRHDPLVVMMAAAIGREGELDDFFRKYSAV